MQVFDTVLESINGATSPILIVIVPFDIEAIFGRKNGVDIKGTVDGYPIERTLLSLGDGRYYFMLNAKMLKSIKKKDGDRVYVEIEEQENEGYKEVEIPDYFLMELEENDKAKSEFEHFNPSSKRWLYQFLTEPKSADAKANRVLKALVILERRYRERLEKEAKKS